MKSERGFALVITLLVTALLVALAVEFASEVYVDTSHSHNFVASQQAGMLAESGITGGIKLLNYDLGSHNGYSSLLDLWAQPQSYDAEVGTITITIEEESGKLNLNKAASSNGTETDFTRMEVRLLKKLGLPEDLSYTVMDWVDDNDTPSRDGAESTYYRTLKAPYDVKNAQLDTVEELALVKGFTPEVLTKLRPCITVYDQATRNEPVTKININTAPKEVLASLDDGMSDSIVDGIMEYRKKNVFKTQADLSKVAGLDGALYHRISGYLAYSGSVYRIHSEAKVGESVAVAEAVVRVTGGLPVFLYWREY